jgi:hypothetical protein
MSSGPNLRYLDQWLRLAGYRDSFLPPTLADRYRGLPERRLIYQVTQDRDLRDELQSAEYVLGYFRHLEGSGIIPTFNLVPQLNRITGITCLRVPDYQGPMPHDGLINLMQVNQQLRAITTDEEYTYQAGEVWVVVGNGWQAPRLWLVEVDCVSRGDEVPLGTNFFIALEAAQPFSVVSHYFWQCILLPIMALLVLGGFLLLLVEGQKVGKPCTGVALGCWIAALLLFAASIKTTRGSRYKRTRS